METEYYCTYEAWFAQAGLLNQIGMQFSKDMSLVESAQSMRSALDMVCRKINCFNESERLVDLSAQHRPCQEDWKAWIRKESLRRLAYTLWVSHAAPYCCIFPPRHPCETLLRPLKPAG